MPARPTQNVEAALQAKWLERGLTPEQAVDMIAIAHELTVVTGKPLHSCLDDVDQQVTELLHDRLISRIKDTITYGSDLNK